MADTEQQLNELPRIRVLLESINAQLRRPPPPPRPGPGGPNPPGPGGPNPPGPGGPNPPGPGGPGPGGRRSSGGMIHSVGDFIGGGITSISKGIFGSIVGALALGVKDAIDASKQYDAILRRNGTALHQSYSMIEANVAKANKGLGMVQDEFAKLAVTISKQSGKAPGADLIGAGQTASTARMLGIDLQQMAQFTGRQSVLTGGSVGEQAIMFGRAVGKYGVQRTEKLLEDISEFSERQVEVTSSASDKQIRAFTEFRAFAESQGPLVGEAVSKVVANMSSAISNPGGGVAGEMFMQEYGLRMGAKDPYEAEYIREKGAFHQGPSGKYGIEVLYDMLNDTSMSEYQKLAMAKRLNFGSMHNVQVAMKAWNDLTPEQKAKFSKVYEDKIAKGETPDVAQYSKIMRMSEAEIKAAYDKAGLKGAGTTEGMRDELLKNTAMEKTPASMLQDAITELRNAVIALAKHAIPPLIIAASFGAKVAEAAGIIVSQIGSVMTNVGIVIRGAMEKLGLMTSEEKKKEEAMASLGDAFTASDVEQEGDEKTGVPGFRENTTQKKRIAEKNKKAIALAAAGDKEGFLKYIRENAPGVREDEAVKMYNALSAQTDVTQVNNERLAQLKDEIAKMGPALANLVPSLSKTIDDLISRSRGERWHATGQWEWWRVFRVE